MLASCPHSYLLLDFIYSVFSIKASCSFVADSVARFILTFPISWPLASGGGSTVQTKQEISFKRKKECDDILIVKLSAWQILSLQM